MTGTTPTPREIESRVRGVRLHQLEGFFHVALQGGFARAAAAMPYPITEPALHQQVRKLERALGTSLLVRGPARRMVTTAEGRALLEFITPYFERLPRVLRELAGAIPVPLLWLDEQDDVMAAAAEIAAACSASRAG